MSWITHVELKAGRKNIKLTLQEAYELNKLFTEMFERTDTSYHHKIQLTADYIQDHIINNMPGRFSWTAKGSNRNTLKLTNG